MDTAYYESALTSTSEVLNDPYSLAVYSCVLAPVLNEVERVAAPSGAALAYPLDPRDADAVGDCEASVDCEGGFGLGVILAGKAVAALVMPLFRSTTLRIISSRPEKNSPAVRDGSVLGAGGKMSAWKESALRGTTKAMGSIQEDEADETTLYARAISHSETLSARRGRKHIPRCGSLDLYSLRGWRVSDSYS